MCLECHQNPQHFTTINHFAVGPHYFCSLYVYARKSPIPCLKTTNKNSWVHVSLEFEKSQHLRYPNLVGQTIWVPTIVKMRVRTQLYRLFLSMLLSKQGNKGIKPIFCTLIYFVACRRLSFRASLQLLLLCTSNNPHLTQNLWGKAHDTRPE